MESGRIDPKIVYQITTILIVGSAIFAALCDLYKGKIYNWFTLPMAGFGLTFAVVSSFFSKDFMVALNSFAGLATGFLLFAWIFRLGAMGGGDVKFLMAIGAWGGFYYTVEVALLSVLVGGIISLGILIHKRRAKDLLHRIYRFVRSIAVKQLEVETFKIDHRLTMPFGVPLAIASVWVWLDHPLKFLFL